RSAVRTPSPIGGRCPTGGWGNKMCLIGGHAALCPPTASFLSCAHHMSGLRYEISPLVNHRMCSMRAMVLDQPNQPLRYTDVPTPQPKANQLLIKVSACGLCRTDLHILDGELNEPALPLIPGHQVVGTVAALGANVQA